MRKRVIVILVMVLTFLCVKVSATEISGNGSAKDYGSGGGGGTTCTDKSVGFSVVSGLRITLVKSNGTMLYSADFYSYQSQNTPTNKQSGYLGNNNCSKIEYIKGTCTKRTNNIYKEGFESFMDTYVSTNNAVAIQYIFDYLEGNNYTNLKSMINKTGYKCIDNVDTTGCSIASMNDTYIVVEPMAMFGSEFATAYEMGPFNDSTYCYLQNKWGRFASFTAPNGTYMGVSLTDKVTDSKGYDDAVKDKNSTNGIMIYRMADIVNIPTEEYGTLKIMKYDINGEKITFPSDYKSDPNVYFYIYYPDGKKVFTMPTMINLKNSEFVTVKLSPGTYTIKEEIAPYGYNLSGKVISGTTTKTTNEITVTIKKDTTTTVKFYNKKKEATCYERAIETTNDPVGRIALYQEYQTKGKNYTNLLNFSYAGADVCSQASCSNDQMNVGCLSVSNVKNNFSYNNLSCYDETIIVGSYTGYCQVTYNLNNNFTGTFGYTETYNFGDNFTSGMMILNRTAQNSLVAQGSLKKTCFVYGNNIGNTVSSSLDGYSSYVGNVTFNGENLTSSEIANTGWIKTPLSTSYNKFEKMILYNYYLNPVYSEIPSGKIFKECKDPNLCRLLGYGFVSKLNSKGEQTVEFSIKLENKLKNLNNKTDITSNACIYLLNNGLIDEELQLEFRTISKLNPFPGKSGDTTRKVGSNWCDGDNCTSSNNIVESVIRNSNDSYDSLNKGPIYRIELNSETIRDIRDYNNGKKYDEYDLECDADATNCKSTFLEHYGITRLQ